jgi:hypothetical protein
MRRPVAPEFEPSMTSDDQCFANARLNGSGLNRAPSPEYLYLTAI